MSSRARKQGGDDINELAFRVVAVAVGEEAPRQEKMKNPAAVALGRAGGLVGGKARAEKLTPEERSRIARQAALKRWAAQH